MLGTTIPPKYITTIAPHCSEEESFLSMSPETDSCLTYCSAETLFHQSLTMYYRKLNDLQVNIILISRDASKVLFSDFVSHIQTHEAIT